VGLCCLYPNASINFQEVRASQLTLWYYVRTTDGHGRNRRRMIVALVRKLLVALWQLATKGLIPEGAMVSWQPCDEECPLSTGRSCGGNRDMPTAWGMGSPAMEP